MYSGMMEWYVMRDLHRGHTKVFAYEELAQKGFRTYTPTVKKPKLDSKGKPPLITHCLKKIFIALDISNPS